MKDTQSTSSLIRKIAPMLLLSVFLLPLTVRAEVKAGSIEVEPFAGYNFFQDRQNLEDSPVFGGRIGYNISNRFGIEATGQFTRSSVDDRSKTFTREGEFTSPANDVDISMYHLDLLYHFMPDSKFNPFVTAGYGIAHYSPRVNHDGVMSIVDFGVGAKYWVAENVALRIDVRDNMVADDAVHNIETTAGVVFRFGGNRSSAAPAAQAAPASQVELAQVAQPLDSDGDGVPDYLDKCPGTPAGVAVGPDGCPPAAPRAVAAAAAPRAVAAAAVPKVVVLSFEDVHFGFDQSTLKPEAKLILKRNIQLLKENPDAQIRIAGYTSAAGSEEYNQKLSERRAASVRAYLVSEGLIEPARLSTIGYGERHPAAYEATPGDHNSAAAKANIRVLFEITVK